MKRAGSTCWLALLGALCLGGCDGSGPGPRPPEPTSGEPAEAAEFPHLGRIRLDLPEDLAAVAPFGLMRVAVADRSPESGLGFHHARVAGAPDLVVNIRNVARRAATDVGGEPRTPGDPEPDGVAASPGRVVALLPSQELVVEATTRKRLAVYRVTVPAGDSLEVRFSWRSSGDSAGQWMPARGRQALNGALKTASGVELHAAVRFDDSFTEVVGESGASLLRFTPPTGVLQIRFALSTTDLAGARGNLADGDGLGFDGVLRSTRAAWDDLLGRLTVIAPDEVQGRVSTDWYRVLAHYGRLEDSDGRFRAPDGSLRRVGDGTGTIGNLDLSREQWAMLPLLDLLAADQLQGLPETLLLHQRVTGEFPRRTAWGWPLPDPADGGGGSSVASAVLAGFVSRGASKVDAQRVLPPVIKASRATAVPTGYAPYDGEWSPAVSLTLDSSRGAQAVAVIAAAAGDRDTAAAYAARAVFYRLLYDSDVGAFRGRDRSGRWRSPFPPSPDRPTGLEDYAEGRWAEAVWTVALFDIEGLLELLGGQQVLGERLDAAFAAGPGADGLDATRPSMQHTPWLYGFTNHPERIGERLEALDASRDDPRAEVAAWRLLRALGVYPVLPADGEYMLAPPGVREAILEIGGRPLRFVSPADGPRAWRGAVWLDGMPLPGRLMSHQRLARGGVITYEAKSGDGAGWSMEE